MTSIQLENIQNASYSKMWICAVMPCKSGCQKCLTNEVTYYNWTGFYWMNDAKNQLELGAYSRRSNGSYQHPLW